MRYRLNRQGMLELDAWLAPLLQGDFHDRVFVTAIHELLDCEPPELLAMMRGEAPLPTILQATLQPGQP